MAAPKMTVEQLKAIKGVLHDVAAEMGAAEEETGAIIAFANADNHDEKLVLHIFPDRYEFVERLANAGAAEDEGAAARRGSAGAAAS